MIRKILLSMLIIIFLIISGLSGFKHGYSKGKKSIPDIQLIIVVPRPGELRYTDKVSQMYACIVELSARWWNRFPSSRKWLKKYIEAWGSDSTFRINEKQIIKFDGD